MARSLGVVLLLAAVLIDGAGCSGKATREDSHRPSPSAPSELLRDKDRALEAATETIERLAARIESLQCEEELARDDLAAKERELALLEETRDAGGNERELLLALDATEARRRDLADKLAFIEKAWDDAIARAQTLERDLAMLGSTLMGSSPRGNSGSSAIDSPDLLALGGPIADPEIALRLRRLRQLEARLVARAQAEADARPSAFRPEGSRAAAESPDDHSLYRDDPSGLWAEVVGLVTERIANLVYGGARWDAFDGLVLCLLILTFIMSVWLAGEPVRWVTRRRLERELEILRRRARELERRYSELGIDHRLLASGEEESGESNAPRLTPVFVPLPAAPREPSPEESASQAYSEALDRALPDDVSSEDQAAATRDAQGTDEDATRVAPGAPHAHALHATPAEPHPRAFRAAPAESLATSPIEEGALPSPITNADAPDQTDGVESATEITPASALPLDIGAHADGASSEGADAADAEISGARFTTTDLSGPIEAFGIDAPRPDTPIILVDAAWPESSKARAFASFDGEGIEPVPPSADSVPIILGATFSPFDAATNRGALDGLAAKANAPASPAASEDATSDRNAVREGVREGRGDHERDGLEGTNTFVIEPREVDVHDARSDDAPATEDLGEALHTAATEERGIDPSSVAAIDALLGDDPLDEDSREDDAARRASPRRRQLREPERDVDREPTGNTDLLDEIDDLIGEAFESRRG